MFRHLNAAVSGLAIAACLCLQAPLALAAGDPALIRLASPLEQPWRISRFHELEGQGVRCLCEDQNGNIWFGLRAGVARYDGYEWKQFTLGSDPSLASVEAITRRSDGTLIAATLGGIYQFEREAWRPLLRLKTGWPGNLSFIKESSDGTLWVGSAWGLLRLSPDGHSRITSSPGYADLLREQGLFDAVDTFPEECLPERRCYRGTGAFLVGTCIAHLSDGSPLRAAGVRCGDCIISVNGDSRLLRNLQCDPGRELQLRIRRFPSRRIEVITVTTDARRPAGFQLPAIYSLHEDRNGRLWVGTNGNRLLRTDDNGDSWQVITPPEPDRLGRKPAAISLYDGTMLIMSQQTERPLWRLDGTTWTAMDAPGLSAEKTLSLPIQAHDGTIWIGGGGKVFLYHAGQWKTYSTADLDLPADAHRMMLADDRSLWLLGHSQYAVRIAMSLLESVSLEGSTYQCTDRDGRQWFIQSDSASVICKQDDKLFHSEPASGISEVDGIHPYRQGVIAVGQHERHAALAIFDGTTWTRHIFPKVGRRLSGRAVTITKDGQIWVAAAAYQASNFDGGVVSGDGESWQHHIPPGAPLAARAIVELPDGRMMFGSSNGITIFDGTTWQDVAHGLLRHNSCEDAAIDGDGVVWAATSTQGILRFDGQRWQALATEAGLSSVHAHRLTFDVDGTLWVSTSRGLHRYDGHRFTRISLPNSHGRQSLQADTGGGIWIDGVHRVSPGKSPPRVLPETTEREIEYGNECVVFWEGIDGWNRSAPESLTYSTRVNDGAWTPFRPGHELILDDLPLGRSKLELRARDEDFLVSAETATISIAVTPRLSQTAWFRGLCVLIVATICGLAIQLIHKAMEIRRSNRELEAARSDLADQVAEKTAEFRAICDCSPVGIFVADNKGRISYTNRRLRLIAGMNHGRNEQTPWIQLVHPEDRQRLRQAWQSAVENGTPCREQGRLRLADKRIVCFALIAEPFESDGERLGYVGAVEDITEKLAADEELHASNRKLQETLDELTHTQDLAIRNERLRALGKMAAGVAHDINNSLSPILSYTELLIEEVADQEHSRRLAELISVGVTDMAETVRRLDHFYRDAPEGRTLQTIGLTDLTEQTIEMTRPRWENAAGREGRQITVQLDARGNPRVRVVSSQLRAALTNLIFNAVEAIIGSGTVTVSVASQHGQALLRVRDNGAGMSPDELKHCLEPFYTSRSRGTGLGLSECHGVVRQHGGDLTIDSVPGTGTTVTISLPQDRSRSATADSRPVATDTDLPASGRVLYIDDNELVRTAIDSMFRALGTECEFASDGLAALDLLDQSSFDLVLCDYGLPGLNGGEVLQRIKSRWPDLPVVITSGWSEPMTADQLPPDGFLPKPVRMKDLADLLRNFVSAPAT